jgi:hypothetical protein
MSTKSRLLSLLSFIATIQDGVIYAPTAVAPINGGKTTATLNMILSRITVSLAVWSYTMLFLN